MVTTDGFLSRIYVCVDALPHVTNNKPDIHIPRDDIP
jgi:hypothetical protein